jgi:hypothetical protein
MPADFLSCNVVDAIKFNLSSYAKEQNKDDFLCGLCLYLLKKVLPKNNKIAQLVYKMASIALWSWCPNISSLTFYTKRMVIFSVDILGSQRPNNYFCNPTIGRTWKRTSQSIFSIVTNAKLQK